MATRRNFMQSVSVLGASWSLPPVKVEEVIQESDFKVRMLKIASYVDYDRQDWLKCRLFLLGMDGQRYWAPPIVDIDERTLTSDYFKIRLIAKRIEVDRTLEAGACQFVDKNRYSLFPPKDFIFPLILVNTDLLNLAYTFSIGPF